MTREETKELLACIRAAYPAFHRGESDERLNRVVAVWSDVFRDVDAGRAMRAMTSYIAENRFAPTPAEVLERVLPPRAVGGDLLADYLPEALRGTSENRGR